jgi:hypothetical protein
MHILGTKFKIASIPSLTSVLAVPMLLGACSSPVSKFDSQRRVAASIASEGMLLAEFVRGGHSTAAYTRGHAQFLESRCEALLSDLNKLKVESEQKQQLQELRAVVAKLEKVTAGFPTQQTKAFELDNVHEQFATTLRAAEHLKGKP